MEVLSTQSLGRRFGAIWAVRGLSMAVSEGEVVGFLGDNGAGKTTSIRMLLGLLASSEGAATVLGERVPASVSAMSRVGYLEERPHFYPWLSVRDNLRVVLEPVGVGTGEIDMAIDRVGLSDAAMLRVRSLSYGMCTRLGIARALCGHPRLVVLDEPTSGLDPSWVRELRSIVRELAEAGVGVLLSSHQLDEVERLCSRVVVLTEGRVTADKPISGLVEASGWYLVRVRPEDLGRAIAALRAFEPEDVGGRLRVRASGGGAVSSALMAAGIAPEGLEPERQTLEAALVRVHIESEDAPG